MKLVSREVSKKTEIAPRSNYDGNQLTLKQDESVLYVHKCESMKAALNTP